MKKFGVFFVLALAFFAFTAQNCQKRDPYVIPGSQGNPKAVGARQGQIDVQVTVLTAANWVKNANVSIYLSPDSVKGNKPLVNMLTRDSGWVSFKNLIPNKYYYVLPTYKEPDPNGSGSTIERKLATQDQQTQLNDTMVASSDAELPTRITCILH